jgi:hypothetical protein
MKEADRITKADVMDLLTQSSPKGVLSAYIGLSASERHDPGRWLSAARSGLKTLAQTHADKKHAQAVIQAAQAEIAGLAVEARHRSLVYFRSLDPDWRFCRSLQLPLADLFAWDQIPQVRPMVAFLDEYPVLGVAVLSEKRARLLTWLEGRVEEHHDLLAEVMVEETPAGASEGIFQAPGINHTLIRKARAEDRTRRFLHVVGRKIGESALARDWQRLLLIGPSSVAAVVADHLPDACKRLCLSPLDRNLIKASVTEISEAAARQLDAWKREAETQEVEGLINEARSGGRACLGLSATLENLHQRRIERLLFCHDLQLSGFRGNDGRLFDRMTGVSLSDSGAGPVVPEPHLVERMVTSALESGAAVIPLEGEAARKLSLLGGVGGRLRYRGADAGLFPERRESL